jgi:hypothetical protein
MIAPSVACFSGESHTDAIYITYTTSPCIKHSGKVSVKIQRSILYHYTHLWNFSIVPPYRKIRIPLVGALSCYCCWAQRLPPAPAYSMGSTIQLRQSVNRCFRYKSSFPIRRRRSMNNKTLSWHAPCPYFRHVVVVKCTKLRADVHLQLQNVCNKVHED